MEHSFPCTFVNIMHTHIPILIPSEQKSHLLGSSVVVSIQFFSCSDKIKGNYFVGMDFKPCSFLMVTSDYDSLRKTCLAQSYT